MGHHRPHFLEGRPGEGLGPREAEVDVREKLKGGGGGGKEIQLLDVGIRVRKEVGDPAFNLQVGIFKSGPAGEGQLRKQLELRHDIGGDDLLLSVVEVAGPRDVVDGPGKRLVVGVGRSPRGINKPGAILI